MKYLLKVDLEYQPWLTVLLVEAIFCCILNIAKIKTKQWKTPGTFGFHFAGCLFGTFPALLGCEYVGEVVFSPNFIVLLYFYLRCFCLNLGLPAYFANSKLQKAGLVFEREKLGRTSLIVYERLKSNLNTV